MKNIRCFFLIFLVFCIVKKVYSQNFSFVQISDMHIGYMDEVANFYEDSVNKINSLIEKHGIQFALVTGDWADHSHQEELDVAVSITEKLNIPYYPALGNHDIINYHNKTGIPGGDYRFMKKFWELFDSKKNINYYTGRNPILYHMDERTEYLQNYQIDFFDGQFIVLVIDWNNRETNRTLRELKRFDAANLHNITGGTLPWLLDRLTEIQEVNVKTPGKVKQVIFAQHHPFRCPFYVPCDGASFSEEMLDVVESTIAKSGISLDIVWGDICGHDHFYFFSKHVFKQFGGNFKEYMDSATRMSAAFAVIEVENWKLKTAYQYCVDCPKEGQLTIIDLQK